MPAHSMSQHSLWQVNGHFGGSLPMSDRGLAYGDGLFETLYFQYGRCTLARFHWARLLKGCERLSIPLSEEQLLSDLQLFLTNLAKQKSVPDGIVKLIVTRGSGGRGYVPPDKPQATLIWQWFPLVESSMEALEGVALSVSSIRLAKQSQLAGLKHLNRLEYVLAGQAAAEDKIPLLLDTDGLVIETLSHNIFFVRAGVMITPSLMYCGVDGVLKQFLQQQLAPSLSVKVQEENISLDQLMAADEVFIGNSVRGFWPVTSLTSNEKTVRWSIGNICRQFQTSHQRYLQSAHG